MTTKRNNKSGDIEFQELLRGHPHATDGKLDWRKQGVRAVETMPFPPIRTSIAAVVLLLLGSAFMTLGIVDMFYRINYGIGMGQLEKTWGFLGLGLIMFIPGSWSTYTLWGAWNRWRGFDYSQVPSWDFEGQG